MKRILDALRRRDANLSALRRSARVAIVAPAVFAITDKVLDNPEAAIFAAFGGVAMLLYADFGGSMSTRIGAEVSLIAGGVVLICLGTLAGQTPWLAALVTFAVAFAVLFAGVVSSVLASAANALLVSFILPVTLGGTSGTLPDRLVGWLLAGGASVIALALAWPAPTREPLRESTARCCTLLARRLRAEVDCDRGGAGRRGNRDRAIADASAAAAAMRTSFYNSPYRPTGLSSATRTLVRLVDQLVWLNVIIERTPLDPKPTPTDAAVRALKMAAADVLARCGALLETSTGDPRQLEADVACLDAARAAMERTVTSAPGFIDSLEPSFRAQEMSFSVSAIAKNTELTVLARRRTWWQHLLGSRPEGTTSPLSSAAERAGAHLQQDSVWLHNSLRGAFVLAVAVLVARETDVQHGFWVVLGALSVLRSNALTTGQNILRALAGTTVGIIIGGILLAVTGDNTPVYWGLFAPALFLAGMGPAVISFGAGQAGFTVTLLVLYNLIVPTGWQAGLVRIQDVAIGAAVSLIAGVVFWPRGASPAFGRAAGEAFVRAAGYLQQAIDYGVPPGEGPVPVAPDDERRQAAAAARRLDDAFRGFLAEKGTKHVPLAAATSLVTSVAFLRLAGDAVTNLWSTDDGLATGDRAAARQELLNASAQIDDWYKRTAHAMSGRGPVPSPLDHDAASDGRFVDAVRRDLRGEDGQGTATAVKMIWTADHLDIARQLHSVVAPPARALAAARAHGWRPRG